LREGGGEILADLARKEVDALSNFGRPEELATFSIFGKRGRR